MISPITILVIAFLIYILLYSINDLYVNIFLSLVFIYVYPNISDKQAGYYLLLLAFSLIYSIIKPYFSVDQERVGSIFSLKFKGYQFLLLNILIAIPVLIIMASLQGSSKTAILGTVQFATFPSSLLVITPAISALLGLVENRFLFTLVDIVKYFWIDVSSLLPSVGELLIILSPIFYVIFPASFFGILHSSAYSYVVVNLLFAIIVASIWIGSYLLLGNSVVADTSHFFWNGASAIGKGLKIVTNSGSSGLPVAGVG